MITFNFELSSIHSAEGRFYSNPCSIHNTEHRTNSGMYIPHANLNQHYVLTAAVDVIQDIPHGIDLLKVFAALCSQFAREAVRVVNVVSCTETRDC